MMSREHCGGGGSNKRTSSPLSTSSKGTVTPNPNSSTRPASTTTNQRNQKKAPASASAGLQLRVPLIASIVAFSTFYVVNPAGFPSWPETTTTKVFFKLVPMFLLLAYTFICARLATRADWLLVVGLAFCTLGDFSIAYVFVYGLGAFLVGHVFYIASFISRSLNEKILHHLHNTLLNKDGSSSSDLGKKGGKKEQSLESSSDAFATRMLSLIRTPRALASAGPLLAYGLFIAYIMTNSLALNGETALLPPVLLYIAIIITMGWAAVVTRCTYATVGSLLFLCSDSVLAWNKFVQPVPHAEIIVMSTYYASQLCIVLSLGHRNGN